MTETVTFFRTCPLRPGQKIRIEDGSRRGDWTVVAADERKMTLRCPISGREYVWDRFCCLAEEREAEFPARSEDELAAFPVRH